MACSREKIQSFPLATFSKLRSDLRKSYIAWWSHHVESSIQHENPHTFHYMNARQTAWRVAMHSKSRDRRPRMEEDFLNISTFWLLATEASAGKVPTGKKRSGNDQNRVPLIIIEDSSFIMEKILIMLVHHDILTDTSRRFVHRSL